MEPDRISEPPVAFDFATSLAWHGTTLLVPSQAAVERVDRPRMSASTTKAMQSCPARFVAEKLSGREPDPMGPSELGHDAHTVHERLYSDPPARRTVRRAVQHIVDLGYERWHQDQEVDRALWQKEVMDKLLPIFKIRDPASVRVLAVEEPLEGISFGDVPIVGYIDLVEEVDAGPAIDDLKTGRPITNAQVKQWGHDEEGDQLRVYCRAYEIKHGVRPVSATLRYTQAARSRKVTVTRPQVQRAVDSLREAWYDLKEYVSEAAFPAQVSSLCSWCPLVNACPAAQAAGKEAKIAALDAHTLAIPIVGPIAAVAPPAASDEMPPPEPPDSQWREEDLPAHTDLDRIIETAIEEHTMSQFGWTRTEGKPWESKTTETRLDPASYEATAVIGLVELAVETLHAGQQRITATTVRALTSTLGAVVLGAQEAVFGYRDWSRSSNVRVRGALRTVLSTLPLPMDEGSEAIAKWQQDAERRIVSILAVALDLFYDNLDSRAQLAAA